MNSDRDINEAAAFSNLQKGVKKIKNIQQTLVTVRNNSTYRFLLFASVFVIQPPPRALYRFT